MKEVKKMTCVVSPEPVWLSIISAGLWGFRPRKDSGVFANPGGDRPTQTENKPKGFYYSEDCQLKSQTQASLSKYVHEKLIDLIFSVATRGHRFKRSIFFSSPVA